MKKVLNVCLGIILGLNMLGCDIETEENFHFVTLPIVAADVPETFTLDGFHNIDVTYIRPDDCTFFEGFDVSAGNNGLRNIVAIGSTLTQQVCTQQVDSVSAVFTVNAQFNGTYNLRFYTGNDENGNPEYLEYEIPVVDGNN